MLRETLSFVVLFVVHGKNECLQAPRYTVVGVTVYFMDNSVLTGKADNVPGLGIVLIAEPCDRRLTDSEQVLHPSL